jgi:hypothetical protein
VPWLAARLSRRVGGVPRARGFSFLSQGCGGLVSRVPGRGAGATGCPHCHESPAVDCPEHSPDQVWWPATDEIRFEGDYLPVWYEARGGYLDPATGELLPTWDQALDTIGPDDEPLHVVRFGTKFDAQGVLAGSKDATRCIGYLTKYLTKQLGDCHQPDTDAQRVHVERLAEALRHEPCSPTCANWLRYGIQPKNPRPGLVAGACKGKAHRYDHLGHAGRRVLVSRKWSGKTLADHRGDRRAWLIEMLGLPATDPTRYRWDKSSPTTTTTCHPADGCCARWPTVSSGRTPSQKLDDEPRKPSPPNFRQPGGLPDE